MSIFAIITATNPLSDNIPVLFTSSSSTPDQEETCTITPEEGQAG